MNRRSNETSDLAALLDVARSVESTLELEPLLDIILDQLKRIADYSGVGMALDIRATPGGGVTVEPAVHLNLQ